MKAGLRWFALGMGVVIGLLVVVVGALYLVGSNRIARTYEVQTENLAIPTGPEAIERGAHLARIHGCTDCHGNDLSGQVFADEPPFRVVASNLTAGRGGVGGIYDAGAFDRAIRHGVRPDGSALLVMPSAAFHGLSDEDVAHIIAYVQSVPPVDNELPPTEVRPLGRVLAVVQLDPAMEVSLEPARTSAPPPSDGAEYGEYLTSITCAYCHGPELRGAQPPNPSSPPAPDLSAAGQWDFAAFEQALRSGIRPDGSQLNPEFMPWTVTAHMSDDELRAIHAHLSSLAGEGVSASR